MKRFIVSGTDTGIGKTIFAAGLTGWLGGQYWKPVQAGMDEETDVEVVARLSGRPLCAIIPEVYRLVTPCSPHQAAQIDGVVIDPSRLTLPNENGPLVVEGAGGVLVPLTPTLLYADMFARWQLPVILVARTSLGTINHSLLSLEALRVRQIAVHGIVFVGDENKVTENTICEIGCARHLGRLPILDPLTAKTLRKNFVENIRTEFLT